MRAGGIGGEENSLERFARGLAGVSIPHAAANEIDPAVAIHVESGEAHVGLIICADDVLHPVRRAAELKPVKPIWFHAATTQHKVQIAIAIEVHQCGQPVITCAAGARRQIAIDEMMLETEVCGGRQARENNAEQSGLNQR